MGVFDIAMLMCAALAAGWVDAVVGGGGLLQIPALMIALPGTSVATALGTNKLVAITGTTSAAVTFARKAPLDRRIVGLATLFAVPSSAAGALVATALPGSVYRPIIMAALLAVGLFVTLRPDFGRAHAPVRLSRRRAVTASVFSGGGIGFYDGVIGSGTGTFLIITFLLVLGADFVHGSAMAKVVNVGTNLGALLVFAAQGHVMWLLGGCMAVANVAGGVLGAHTALKRGTAFVRFVLLGVVSVLVVKLGIDQWG